MSHVNTGSNGNCGQSESHMSEVRAKRPFTRHFRLSWLADCSMPGSLRLDDECEWADWGWLKGPLMYLSGQLSQHQAQ